MADYLGGCGNLSVPTGVSKGMCYTTSVNTFSIIVHGIVYAKDLSLTFLEFIIMVKKTVLCSVYWYSFFIILLNLHENKVNECVGI